MEIPLEQHCSKSSHKSNDVFIFVLGQKLNPTHHFAAMGQMGQKVIIFIFFHHQYIPRTSLNLKKKIKFIS